MSFSSTTKNELSRIRAEGRCCQMAELSALIRTSGSIRLKGLSRTDLSLLTENPAIARLIFTFFKKNFNIHTDVVVQKNKTLKKGNAYQIQIEDAGEILKAVGILVEVNGFYSINDQIPEFLLNDTCCKRAYIRGAFLGGGSVSDPEKGYHLEFITHNEEYGDALKLLINSFGLDSKLIDRKANHIVYLKEGDQIVDLLNIIGAHRALMDFENVRIVKQMRNDVNRLVNCETANLNKTVNAAMRQVQDIELIKSRVGLGVLPQGLIQLAELRVEQPEASLKELGELLDPPVGKSGVNHRFKKIHKFAESLVD